MRDIDRYGDVYVSNESFEKWQVLYRRKKILEEIELYKPKSILEIGCGMNPLGKYLNSLDLHTYTVVEPNEKFYKNAREILNNQCGGGGIISVEIINEPFSHDILKNTEYDMIICSSLLHELENPDDFLKELYFACCYKTVVHINVPNANSFHRILALRANIISDVMALSDRNILLQQHSVFNMETLITMLKNSKFNIIAQGQYFLKPFSHEQMFKLMKYKIIDEKVLNGLYEMGKNGYGSEIYVDCNI